GRRDPRPRAAVRLARRRARLLAPRGPRRSGGRDRGDDHARVPPRLRALRAARGRRAAGRARLPPGGRAVAGKRILAARVAAAAILGLVEVAMGAFSPESPKIANACAPREPFPGGGVDAVVQRVVLNALDGAACRLHTSREELVLSLDPNSTFGQKWDR